MLQICSNPGNIFILFLFLALTKLTSSQRLYAQYSVDLQNLERFETLIVDQLTQKFSTTNSTKISTIAVIIENYVEDFKEVRGLSSPLINITKKDETPASKNPICSYRLLRRIQTTLQNLVSNGTFQEEFSKLAKQITSFLKFNNWPDRKDIEQIVMATLRIQYEYNLKAEELANGRIHKIPTHCKLHSIDCQEFAKIAYESGQYAFAIEWLEVARKKAMDDGNTKTQDLLDPTLKDYIQTHNRYFDSGLGWEPTTFNRKIRPNIPQDSKTARRRWDVLYNAYKNQRENLYKEITFWGLCSGDILQTEREKANLFCWQEFKAHPSFTIGPVKMEFLSRNPDVVQVYEVFNENDMKAMKLETETSMHGSEVSNANLSSKGQPPKNYRTSVNEWYSGSKERALNEKVSMVMGLNPVNHETSEKFQVAAYSPGGFFGPHVDTGETEFVGKFRNRIATLMIYLNDVDEGGYTAFTSLGFAVKPAKGSAVFWHNTFSDGNPDPATIHGACPVILGEKWASNKWIKSNGQFLVRKCGLKQGERFRVPVNNVYLPIPKVFKRGSIDVDFPSIDPWLLAKYSYLSPHGLRSLAELDKVLYLDIKNIYNDFSQKKGYWDPNNREKYTKINMYLQDFDNSVMKANQIFSGGPEINPLGAYKLIYRFIGVIQNLAQEPDFGDELLIEISSRIGRTYKASDGPTFIDMKNVIFSIVNIQFTYDLSAQDIAAGMLDGVNTGVKLNPEDCFNIGNEATKLKFYSNGVEWLELGLHLMGNGNNSLGHSIISYEDFHDALATAQVSHDEEYLINNWQESPKMFSRSLSEVPEPPERIAIKSVQHEDPKYENNSLTQFSSACSAKLHQAKSKPEKLVCWYEREIHPTFKIGPIKAELFAGEQLEIVQFHDIFSEEQTDSLMNHTINHPHTRPVFSNISSPIKLQVMTTPSVDENEIEAAKIIIKLAQLLTGLKSNKSSGNKIHISAYTPGGYYTEHNDDTMVLDTIATFMVYLSDVKKGGETVFTRAGIKTFPKRGSAFFWYNRFSCGTPNDWTTHGGCPVIFGEKWISVWWLFSEWQSHLQCHLKPNTPYEVLMYGKSKFK